MNELIEQLRLHEGVRSKVYLCSEGFETIGVGRNVSESGIGLSDDEIAYLLANDIARCEKEIAERFDWFDDLDPVRQDALVDMAFNLGITRLAQFQNMLGALSEGRFDDAAAEALDSRWARQVGQRAQTVAAMIRTGERQL
jgi:lysozyme